jgi:hypothetical protein
MSTVLRRELRAGSPVGAPPPALAYGLVDSNLCWRMPYRAASALGNSLPCLWNQRPDSR